MRHTPPVIITLTLLLWCLPLSLQASDMTGAKAPVYGYEVINAYPHDPEAFTQGLLFENGYLYESTGHYGKSTVRKVKLETGEVLLLHRLDDTYFGEGITILGYKLVQLTHPLVPLFYGIVGLPRKRVYGQRRETFTGTTEGALWTEEALRTG